VIAKERDVPPSGSKPGSPRRPTSNVPTRASRPPGTSKPTGQASGPRSGKSSGPRDTRERLRRATGQQSGGGKSLVDGRDAGSRGTSGEGPQSKVSKSPPGASGNGKAQSGNAVGELRKKELPEKRKKGQG